jgi:hypothetical protein
MRLLTVSQFIEKATAIHGSKYDYSAVTSFEGTKKKVKIKCSEHGLFLQTPMNHLAGNGCQKCWIASTRGNTSCKWTGYGEISGRHWKSILANAVVRNLCVDISIEYAWDLFLKQDRRCALTGCPLEMHIVLGSKHSTWTASLDRIDSNKGYVVGNVQWVHKDIQRMKTDFTPKRFYELCFAVVEHRKL